MASYKSVVRLNQAVQNANPTSVLSLRRLGTRRFLLEVAPVAHQQSARSMSNLEGGEAPLEFVFGQGFRPKLSASQPRAQLPVFKMAFYSPAALVRSPRVIVIAVSTVVAAAALVLLVAMASPFGLNPEGAGPDVGASRLNPGVSVGHSARALNSENAQGATSACPSALVQAEQAVMRQTDNKVMADEILGGVRQLTFIDACTNELVQVRMYKLNNTWKAKSATPLGSHSLN